MCSPTNAAAGPTVTSNQSLLLYIYATGIITIVVAVLSLLKEAYQAIQFKLRYITVYNMVEVVLYISALVLAFAVVRVSECLCPHRIQYQFGAVAVFLAWINFVLYFRKLAYTGKGSHFDIEVCCLTSTKNSDLYIFVQLSEGTHFVVQESM